MNNSDTGSQARQIAQVLLGGITLLIAVAAQFILQSSPEGLMAGLLISGVAIIIFVRVAQNQPPAILVRLVARSGLSYRLLFVGFAFILSITATLISIIYETNGIANFLPVLLLWLAGGLAYLAAFLASHELKDQLITFFRTHRQELIVVGLITLGGAVLRFYLLGSFPRVINGDEGLLGQFALQTQILPLANPFSLFANFGGIHMQAIAAPVFLLGVSPFALRLIPAIGGTLAIVAIYVLGRRLFGPRVAAFAAIMLAVSHAHIHFSRTVAVGYIQGTWFAPFILYFFISGIENKSARRLAIGGLMLGAFFGVYIGAQILAAFLIAYTLIALVAYRNFIQPAIKPLIAFWGGTLVIGLPLAVYGFRHPAEFMDRLNADGVFQSGWLNTQMAETGLSPVAILAERVAHVFLSLNYYPATSFYGVNVPILGLITGALFLFGVIYALLRTREHRHLLLNGYFWSGVVSIGVFSIPPDADSYRLLIALPAAIVLAAVGLEQLIIAMSLHTVERRPVLLGLTAILMAAITLLNLRTYFVDFVAQCRYGNDPQTRFASYLGNYLRDLDRETEAYLLSTDMIQYGTHPSVDFLSGNLPVTNIPGPANEMKALSNSVVIAHVDRADELTDWAHANPGGELHHELDCNKLILVSYEIP